MSPPSTFLLGLAMSTDAFAVAIGKGAAMGRPQLHQALRTGLIFGFIEMCTPLLGWLIGRATVHYVHSFAHWIAFVILLGLGIEMIVGACRLDAENTDNPNDCMCKAASQNHWRLAVTGLATSLDAMAIGVSMAYLELPIVKVALVIGLCTLLMVTLGVLLGRVIGSWIGRRAEILGGMVLIVIGLKIVLETL